MGSAANGQKRTFVAVWLAISFIVYSGCCLYRPQAQAYYYQTPYEERDTSLGSAGERLGMKYLGKLDNTNNHDVWTAAIDPAFKKYNQPNTSPEKELEIVESFDKDQRYALSCRLLENEIGNGGLDLVFRSIGLLVPQIAKGLEFYKAEKQLETLQPVFKDFDLDNFSRNHDKLLDKWNAYAENNRELIEEVEFRYWELMDSNCSLKEVVEKHIKSNLENYFESNE